MEFFVSITTIQKYKPALDVLLDSLPTEFRKKYILVYQNEDTNSWKVFDDGHIEVYIQNNIWDYGIFLGLHMLLEANIVPQHSWFLCIHDTCKFLDNCVELIYNLLETYKDSEYEIIWLSNTGQCNICFVRKPAIEIGNSRYKDIRYMTKMETIAYEWNHGLYLSPKSFPVKQLFVPNPSRHLGMRYVYNTIHNRCCLVYDSINMEKYYFHTDRESDHPFSP